MKLVFDEDKINIVLMMVNQLRVEGVQQAGLLVNINNLLTNGEKVEENKTENKDKKEEN